jgi:hypothetical protein
MRIVVVGRMPATRAAAPFEQPVRHVGEGARDAGEVLDMLDIAFAARDPLTAAALNRETVNSMRFMLEAADIDCDGPVGSVKLQGLAMAWGRVLDAWFQDGFSFALETLDREIARGERYVEHVEDFARITRPFADMANRLLELGGMRRRHAPSGDDDWPHPSA